MVQFISDSDVTLLPSECELIAGDSLLICFGESGGQTESDPDGWSRTYYFTIGPDFTIIDLEYQQG